MKRARPIGRARQYRSAYLVGGVSVLTFIGSTGPTLPPDEVVFLSSQPAVKEMAPSRATRNKIRRIQTPRCGVRKDREGPDQCGDGIRLGEEASKDFRPGQDIPMPRLCATAHSHLT